MPDFTPENLIDFWFSERVSKLWYMSTPEFDLEVEEKFSSLYQAACDGQLKNWKMTAIGCLALIIIFDQYPLNVYRNDKRSFVTENQALEISEYALNEGYDKQLTKSQKSFMYMPFMHSEAISHQQRSLILFKSTDPEDFKFAQHHHDIIVNYGRFPHRNKILGRESTSDEIEYLASKDAFSG